MRKKKWDEVLYITYDELKELHGKYSELETVLKEHDTDQLHKSTFTQLFETTLESILKREIKELSDEHKLEAVRKSIELEERFYALVPDYYRNWWWPFVKHPTRSMDIILKRIKNEGDEQNAGGEYVNDVNRKEVEKLEKNLEREFFAQYPKEDKKKRRLRRKRRRFDKLKQYFLSEELEALAAKDVEKPTEIIAEPMPMSELFPEAPAQNEKEEVPKVETPPPGTSPSEPETPPPKTTRRKASAKQKKKSEEQVQVDGKSEQLPGQITIDKLMEKDNAGRDKQDNN